jgi:hypothetical protein
MADATLLPCPFCDGRAELFEDNDPSFPWSVRTQHGEGCFLAYSNTNRHRSYTTEAEAIAAWNTRQPPSQVPAEDVERQRRMSLLDSRKSLVTGDDGYVVFWPTSSVGAYTSYDLREIADELDKRNAAWDAIIQSDPRISSALQVTEGDKVERRPDGFVGMHFDECDYFTSRGTKPCSLDCCS